jgi:hypothetical protein
MMKRFTVFLICAILIPISLAAQLTQEFASVTRLDPLQISNNTSDKPQSKVWNYDGKWWTVLTNSTGTYLWRLDGTSWTDVLKISPGKYAKADCKIVGDVTHILLFRGNNTSYLVSVEYVPTSGTYKLWSQRTSKVDLTFDIGVETASIEIDGKGRMWIASDAAKAINVRWSDAPYTTWSTPITIARKIKDDDICGIIALPGKIGVFWSNQNTRRFGFKTHTDGAAPAKWSADEVPASQSALDIGRGMADDHMNMAIASDGTLYCAVKTSYDTPGYPKLALLIRRPEGTWDNLYEVTQIEGTRPVVILNEALGKLKVIYTSSEQGGDILYRESSTSSILFCSSTILMSGKYNYATSSKANYSSEALILATDQSSNSLYAVGVLGTDSPSLVTDVPSPCAPEKFEEQEKFIVYPNPFWIKSTINFVLPESDDYLLVLYDGKGVQMAYFWQGRAEAGELNIIEIDGSKLDRGLYIAKLQTRRSVKTLKLILER